jgi:hypothetical protein
MSSIWRKTSDVLASHLRTIVAGSMGAVYFHGKYCITHNEIGNINFLRLMIMVSLLANLCILFEDSLSAKICPLYNAKYNRLKMTLREWVNDKLTRQLFFCLFMSLCVVLYIVSFSPKYLDLVYATWEILLIFEIVTIFLLSNYQLPSRGFHKYFILLFLLMLICLLVDLPLIHQHTIISWHKHGRPLLPLIGIPILFFLCWYLFSLIAWKNLNKQCEIFRNAALEK